LQAAKFKAIAEPPKERFYESGHFSAAVDLAICEMLQLGVSCIKVPQLFHTFARLYQVKLPTGKPIKVPGPWVNGKRTSIHRIRIYSPGVSHVKEMRAVSNQLNKLHIGEWLVEHIESDETSCCYIADGAESQQLDYLGQLFARRVNGKLDIKALDLALLRGKSAADQAAAFEQSLSEVADLMQTAGADQRIVELIRRFTPTCSMNDRASPARAAARRVLGLPDGDDDPTCAEHALVNILEAERKAMDTVLCEMMNITDEQADGDAAKIKAMRTCVGWFSSPACALIYQVAKYVALCSSKGYAIGQKFLEWIEARLADADDAELLGHSEDILAICGGRMYVFFLDAAPTERLVSQEGSLRTFLEEEAEMGSEGGGKLRKSILTGASSAPMMATLRAMALTCESVLWPLLRAVKPAADKHVLDVLPDVWPKTVEFFRDVAQRPAGVLDGSLTLDVGGPRPAPASDSQAKRSDRARIDMKRIRAAAAGDATVERLLKVAYSTLV
jgi:hypothetical protein